MGRPDRIVRATPVLFNTGELVVQQAQRSWSDRPGKPQRSIIDMLVPTIVAGTGEADP